MTERRRITAEGIVQGVGFRPFVYSLAQEMGIGGWVVNSPQGVTIEVEAPAPLLDTFIRRLQTELPPHATITHLDNTHIPPLGEQTFTIRQSEHHGLKTTLILPDLATCDDCLHEILDPSDRRYRYPFTNCTHCGPRFSIIQSLPYDRANTTMRGFVMCEQCRAEYENPLDRRFHAQPTACPKCGPQLALWNRKGQTREVYDDALMGAAEALRNGRIAALKGLGGFQLLADARDSNAVARLRALKARYEKPFAVMLPTLSDVGALCEVSDAERRLLQSAAAPIVLLRYRGAGVSWMVAPDNPYLGVMLPYTPLHHLLMRELGFPVVATSGNLSGEPIATDNRAALAKLGGIADLFLVHNRPIARHVDDSVVFALEGDMVMLRRARGYAPSPVPLNSAADGIVAVGAQQKNTIAVAHHGSAILSQYLGDMDNAAVFEAFQQGLADLQNLHEMKPTTAACDLHPDYTATRHAEAMRLKVVHVQHHYAHVLSCMAEHSLEAPVLGVAWDGTGYGTDGTIWGGEFLHVDGEGFSRAAHLRPFPLPGGDLAAKEPRRSALGVLYALYGKDLPQDRLAFSSKEFNLLLAALERGVNTPLTSSMGRLFDVVAALTGLRQQSNFEAQAAMMLEYAQAGAITDECYPIEITPVTGESGLKKRIIEWKPMIAAILDESDVPMIAAKFHNTLAALTVSIAQQVGEPNVVLTGGCFQNRTLLAKTIHKLREAGFKPYWHQRIPANDGGIALGQLSAVIRESSDVSGSSGQAYQRRR